jgi:amino acid transporter
MFFDYFAGALFTSQEVFLFCVVAFVIFGSITGAAIFIGRKLLKRPAKKGQESRPGLSASLLIGFAIVAAIILIFFVIPTMVKDSRWDRRQQTCAKQVGYASPAEDNSSIATAESQSAYRQCLGL